MKKRPQKNRFRVALSFPGEHRGFVEQVSESLCGKLPRETILYDRYYEAEFARPNLDTHLLELYRNQSELVVVFLCAEYDSKEWCRLEWRAIRDLLKQRDPSSVMLFRFDDTEIPGLFSLDGHIRVDDRTPEEVAELILERLGWSKEVDPNKPQAASGGKPALRHRSDVVSGSGDWVLLDSDFFRAKLVRTERNGTISVHIIQIS